MRALSAAPLAALLVSALGLAGCGSLLSAEVVVERFCVTQTAVAGAAGMPQVPVATGVPISFTPPLSFPVALPPMLRTSGNQVELRLLDATVTPTPAGTQVQGISRLDIDVVPASGPLVPALTYVRTGSPTAPAVTVLPMAGHGVDLVGLMQGDQLNLSFTMTTDGAVPQSPGSWNIDIEMCLYGKTVISYL